MGCAASSSASLNAIKPLAGGKKVYPEEVLSSEDEITLVGGQSTRRPSHASTFPSVNERHTRPSFKNASRGASASSSSSEGNNADCERFPGLSSSTSKTSLTLGGSADISSAGAVITRIPSMIAPSRRSSDVNDASKTAITAPLASPTKFATEIISGLGWGHGPQEVAAAVADTIAAYESSNPASWHSLRQVTEYLSPSGSVELVNYVSPLPSFEGTKFAITNASASVSAEDIIDTIKSKHDDEGYSIEEFTASAAFGIQLNEFDHSNSKSVIDFTRALASSDDVSKSYQMGVSSMMGGNHISFTPGQVILQHKSAEVYPNGCEKVPFNSSFKLSAIPSKSLENAFVDSYVRGNAIGNTGNGLNMFTSPQNLLPPVDRDEIIRPGQPKIQSIGYDRVALPSQNSSGGPNTAVMSTDAIRDEMPRFEKEIKRMMYPENFRAGDLIIRKHEIGMEMYFLSKGRVEVISGDGRTVYSTINRGSFFGELGVLFNVPRTASVRAITDCFCQVLTRGSLEEVLQYFPHIAERFHTVAEQRMKEVNRKRSYRRMLEVKTKMDVVDELPEEMTE